MYFRSTWLHVVRVLASAKNLESEREGQGREAKATERANWNHLIWSAIAFSIGAQFPLGRSFFVSIGVVVVVVVVPKLNVSSACPPPASIV